MLILLYVDARYFAAIVTWNVTTHSYHLTKMKLKWNIRPGGGSVMSHITDELGRLPCDRRMQPPDQDGNHVRGVQPTNQDFNNPAAFTKQCFIIECH